MSRTLHLYVSYVTTKRCWSEVCSRDKYTPKHQWMNQNIMNIFCSYWLMYSKNIWYRTYRHAYTWLHVQSVHMRGKSLFPCVCLCVCSWVSITESGPNVKGYIHTCTDKCITKPADSDEQITVCVNWSTYALNVPYAF